MGNPGMRLGPSCLHVVSWTSGRVGRHCAEARDRDIDHDQAGNNPITDFDENIGLLSIPQVPSCREDLFRLSLHSRPKLRERKDRKKRFYNNVNSKKLKCLEELVTANCGDAERHLAGGGEVLPT
jgi:hypothetical protein